MLTQAPKGTLDLLPQDAYRWQIIDRNMRRICENAGYREIRTPIFEHTELFQRGVGDTTDVVRKEMYTFEDKFHHAKARRHRGRGARLHRKPSGRYAALQDVLRRLPVLPL